MKRIRNHAAAAVLAMMFLCAGAVFAQFRQSAGESIQSAAKAGAAEHSDQPAQPEQKPPATGGAENDSKIESIDDLGSFEIKPYVQRIREIERNNFVHFLYHTDKDYHCRRGRVTVNVAVGRDGKLLDTRITESSGQEDLDELALQIVERSDPLPPIPRALKNEVLHFRFTFAFAPWQERASGVRRRSVPCMTK
jgi:TonB family protein